MKPDRPIEVLAVYGVRQRLPLRMALNARVVGVHEIELRRIHDVARRRLPHMFAPWTVAALTADVPFRGRFGLSVVIHGMAAVAQWSGRARLIVGGVMR